MSGAWRVVRLACHTAVIAWGAAFFAASIFEAPLPADAAEVGDAVGELDHGAFGWPPRLVYATI